MNKNIEVIEVLSRTGRVLLKGDADQIISLVWRANGQRLSDQFAIRMAR